MTTISGNCLCGAVTYSLSEPPLHVAQCHCTDCQKYSGTGHATNAAFAAQAFTVTGPLTTYTSRADSGKEISRSFCKVCGSPICSVVEALPGMIVVPAGSMQDPSLVTPQLAFFTSRAPKWDKAMDGIPAFPEMPPA